MSKKNWEQSNQNKEEYYAVKAIPKKKVDLDLIDQIRQEILILNTLDHPNIIKYFEEWQNEKYFYLVQEYLDGGDLYDKLVENQE